MTFILILAFGVGAYVSYRWFTRTVESQDNVYAMPLQPVHAEVTEVATLDDAVLPMDMQGTGPWSNPKIAAFGPLQGTPTPFHPAMVPWLRPLDVIKKESKTEK